MVREINLTDREWAELGQEDFERRQQEIQDARDRIDSLRHMLTPKQWEVLEGYHWQGQTQQEIADEMGVSQQAVAKTLENIKKKARKGL